MGGDVDKTDLPYASGMHYPLAKMAPLCAKGKYGPLSQVLFWIPAIISQLFCI